MLADISIALSGVIDSLGVFGSVNEPPGERVVYPAAYIWLVKDARVVDKPSVTRVLTWAVQMTSYDDSAATALLPVIDSVRNALSKLRLPGHGHLEVEVPEIELAEYKHPGPTIYVATVRLTVFPETFSLQ